MGMKELKPEVIEAYFGFSKALDKSTTLTQREKELVAIGVAHALQCSFCIEDHVRKARIAGVKEEEIAEAVLIAAKVRAGAVLSYAQHYAFPKKEE